MNRTIRQVWTLAFVKKAGKVKGVKERVMCKSKNFLATLGAVLILFASFQPILAGPKPWDEHPWNGYCNSSTAVSQQSVYTYYQIQFSPTGGFYLIRVSFATAKAPATGVPKTVKPKQ